MAKKKSWPAVDKPRKRPFADVRGAKGFGPNRASGHKGGIARQGSKCG